MSASSNTSLPSLKTQTDDRHTVHVRIVPLIDNPNRCLLFDIVDRRLTYPTQIKIGRYSERKKEADVLSFRTKVVSRSHCELFVGQDGKVRRKNRSDQANSLALSPWHEIHLWHVPEPRPTLFLWPRISAGRDPRRRPGSARRGLSGRDRSGLSGGEDEVRAEPASAQSCPLPTGHSADSIWPSRGLLLYLSLRSRASSGPVCLALCSCLSFWLHSTFAQELSWISVPVVSYLFGSGTDVGHRERPKGEPSGLGGCGSFGASRQRDPGGYEEKENDGFHSGKDEDCVFWKKQVCDAL